ncbi:unnamed protein product, partial [Laminaria digitata]
MGEEQGEASRDWKQRYDMAEDMSSWFCQLSTQERLQAIAVEDVVWIRLFNVLNRKHKSWMRQQGTPPTWDRDKVRKIYDKLQRSERNRVGPGAAHAPAPAPTSTSNSTHTPATTASSSAMATAAPSQHPPPQAQAEAQGQGQGQVERPPPPSFMPAPRIVSSQADAGAASSSTPTQTKAMPAEVLPARAGDESGGRREEDRVAGPPEAETGAGGVGDNGRPGVAHA